MIVPFDQREGYIWLDGVFVPWKEAKIHVLTHGLNYASSVFEGERIYHGTIFKSYFHTKRLRSSANLLGFDIPFADDQINKAKEQLVTRQNISDGYIKMLAWRGTEQMSVEARQTKIHMMIATWEWPSYYKKNVMETGVTMVTSRWVRPSSQSFPCAGKATGSYVINTLSKHEAMDAGYDDALMLDYRGYVAEGASSNLFLVINDELHTPIPDCFLNGITRQTVIELARKYGVPVRERHILPEELGRASEVFLTGTASEITPVVKIDNYDYKIGPVTLKLHKYFKDFVNEWSN